MSTSPTKKTAEAPKAEQSADKEAAKAPKMVKIKVLRSHPRLGYSAGDEGSIPQDLYDELIAGGEFFTKI